MSSASAADCTHWRANRSNPGATSEKQFLQFSWLATGSMTFSRSLLSRRRQVEILSMKHAEKLRFRNCAQNQIADPIRMRDSLAIRSQRFHRRIHTQVAVRAVGILPTLVPVKRRFNSRVPRAEKLQALLDPRRLAHGTRFCRCERELASRPLGNHDGL